MVVFIGLIIGLVSGVALNIPTVLIAVATGGAVDGGHILAKLLFPYSMLLTRFLGDGMDLPHIVLALGQFPLYGGVIGMSFSWKRLRWSVVGVLAVLHVLAAVACLVGPLS